ncbi:hypothetical protein D3C73_886640 [compost metagenome]
MPCSACARRSAATNSGLAVSSAITSTSEGPAGMSMLTLVRPCIIDFAFVTNWLPGPKILSTLGIDWVPNAIAATACAPPTR